jgi:hypothetical protein
MLLSTKLMDWKKSWQAFRHHVFVGVTLLGCLAPWVTPRLFPSHLIPIRTNFEESSEQERVPELISKTDIWLGQMEVLQNAC